MLCGSSQRTLRLKIFVFWPETGLRLVQLDAACVEGLPASGICPRNFRRKRFSIRPNGAILEVLLLPNRDGALERIDKPSAGVKGRCAMRRGDRDQHAGLANFEPPQPVDDRNIANLELLEDLRRHR